MRDVLIVGAGGYGRVAYSQMHDDVACNKEWRLVGFLDTRADILDRFSYDVGIVGDPFTYVPRPNDWFVCALGEPAHRRRYVAPLVDKGGFFINIVTEAYLGQNVRLGHGCFFERRVTIGPDCQIGNFVMIHSLAILGHDIVVGDFAQIGCFCFIGGGVRVEEGATIYPHATVLPGLTIGAGATVGAGSVVLADVPAGCTVFGNPAKRVL